MAEEDRVDISEEVNPPAPTCSQPPPTYAPPPLTPAGVLPAYSGAPSTHLPPLTSSGVPLQRVSLTSSTSDDHARIAALEGTINQLAASMTTNMAELFALLRGLNRASSSSTPPWDQGPTADPTSWIPPTQVLENTDVPTPPTTHTAAAHRFTIPYPPPPAPAAAPLPPATFLTSDQVLSAPPPVSMLAPTAAYTVPPPTPPLQPHTNFPYQAPPPINTTFLEPGTSIHTAQFASPTHFFTEADTEQERRLKRMEETIRVLQASEARPNTRYGDCSLFPGMRLPSKVKIPEFRTYEGTTDPRHHLRHYRGKMLQYWDYEEFVIHSFQDSLLGSALDWFMSLKAEDIPTWADLSRKFIDQMEGPTGKGEEPLKKAPATTTSSSGRRRKEVSVNAVNPAHPTPQQYSVNVTLNPYLTNLLFCTTTSTPTYGAVARCPPSPSIPTPGSEGFSANTTSPTPAKSTGRCGTTATPQAIPVPVGTAVGFARIDASPAPFVIDIPAREPYSDDKVSWTYEGGVGSLEQQFGVMGITRSGRLYKSPAAADKGKAPAIGVEAIPEAPPTPPKKVTEEEAEAFMKIIKASEYKVVEQMAKSPAHISLLALLLSSKPHREALLRLKFAVEERIITVKGEEDYAIYKETVVPYISVENDENLPFHSFETISVIWDYGEIGPSRADCMIGKVLLRHNYIPDTSLGARWQGINHPIEVEEYKHRRGLGFRPSCHEIIEARRGNHLQRLVMHYRRLNRGVQVPPLSHFFPGPPLIIGNSLDGPSSDLDDTSDTLPTVYAITEESPSGVHIRQELNNWTSVPRYSVVIADV
ncbi:hypothetical protein CRG98_010725 [Punica granatum]|uniref:G-patch domain-containing protein n=1 Tax=Punica granatum TaxID=22663 RepID=A0A2I0KKN3_PUNGR|nr:hypothetical protein CRG98_010725 [Punica granatum]